MPASSLNAKLGPLRIFIALFINPSYPVCQYLPGNARQTLIRSTPDGKRNHTPSKRGGKVPLNVY
jgi:hypothetical protein